MRYTITARAYVDFRIEADSPEEAAATLQETIGDNWLEIAVSEGDDALDGIELSPVASVWPIKAGPNHGEASEPEPEE